MERSARLAAAFARGMSRSPQLGWCGVCAEHLVVSGAGVTIMSGNAAGPLCSSTDAVGVLEEAQFTVGEGPCAEAFRTGSAVQVPAFDGSAAARWPTFAPLAVEQGMGAVFAFPLAVDGAKVGVLSLYQEHPGELTDEQQADVAVVAEVLAEAVLSLQDASPPGELAVEIDDVVAYRAEIYQASGILAVRLGISAADALVLLRGHAFAEDVPLAQVASAVVDGRLRLGEDER